MRRLACLCGLTFLAFARPADARPVAPALFCDAYPDAPMCLTTGEAPCATCHTQQPALDAFGLSVEAALLAKTPVLDDAAFATHLGSVLAELEGQDADADGFINADEIDAGSYPGEAASFPGEPICPSEPIGPYHVCQWDSRFTYLRVWQDFCGHRPAYEDVLLFESLTEDERKLAIHETLDVCLATEFWRGRDGAVWQLAHRKVRPVLGIKGILGADYDDDYALFAWANLDHHDVREVLTAQYFVDSVTANGVTVYAQTPSLPGQPMQADKRAGSLTSSWVLLYNTMFSAVPRTAAAQAYRGYLNLDIAKLEGLDPAATTPVDYDGAGIAAAECATCHATLEPLTYPFTRYNGIQGAFFVYDPNRMVGLAAAFEKPNLADVPETGTLLGQQVTGLTEWAEVAANSDQFYQAVAADYWQYLVGAEPSVDQAALYADYDAVWQSLRADPGHSVFNMLHVLVDTEAYGAP